LTQRSFPRRALFGAALLLPLGASLGACSVKGIKNPFQGMTQGVAEPQKRKVVALLGMSAQVTEQSKLAGMQDFCEVNDMMQESITSGLFRDQPAAFVSAIMGALADTTIDFIRREPDQAERYAEAGFQAFWSATAKE